MVEHGLAMPCSVLICRDDGGEGAAVQAALETVPLAGRMATLDALHTNRALARPVVETHGAHWMMAVKENASETWETFGEVDWERDATGGWSETAEPGHGRIERRSIEVVAPVRRLLNHPHVRQIFRVTREGEEVKGCRGRVVTQAYGMTSDADASPERLLEPNRGHWSVEANHNIRDRTFREDACLARTGHGPANSAAPDMCAIAVIKHGLAQGWDPRPPPRTGKAKTPRRPPDLPEVRRHPVNNRRDALRMATGGTPA